MKIIGANNFWNKYSPNNESYVSLLVSFVVHVSLIALVMLLGWEGLRKAVIGDVNRRLGVSSVQVGGGASSGINETKNDDDTLKFIPKTKINNDDMNPDIPVKIDPLPDDKVQVEKGGAKTLVDNANVKAKELSRMGENIKSKLADSLKGVGGKAGTGVGDGRGERMLRWVMIFNTANGGDYLSQLMDMNARIAFPDSKIAGKFSIITNLGMKPLSIKDLDLSSISDIFWIDDKPQSVANLSRAIGLSLKVDAFVVLMPASVEEKLVKLEKNALQNGKEEDIEETRFSINKVSGRYEPFKAEIIFKKK